jgi:RNA polymerase sigma-70 factor (ECF subfamily)
MDPGHPLQLRFLAEAPRLRGYLYALAGDHHLADDLLQEVFLAIGTGGFDPAQGDFSAWCRGIARNKVREAARARRNSQGLPADVLELLADAAPAPAEYDLRLEAVRTCLPSLAPRARQVLEARFVEGSRPQAIAAAIGWTANAVSVALSRALAALKTCVEGRLARG